MARHKSRPCLLQRKEQRSNELGHQDISLEPKRAPDANAVAGSPVTEDYQIRLVDKQLVCRLKQVGIMPRQQRFSCYSAQGTSCKKSVTGELLLTECSLRLVPGAE